MMQLKQILLEMQYGDKLNFKDNAIDLAKKYESRRYKWEEEELPIWQKWFDSIGTDSQGKLLRISNPDGNGYHWLTVQFGNREIRLPSYMFE